MLAVKRSFFGNDKAILTAMVQADNPVRIKHLMDVCCFGGAEAYGIQFEQFSPEYRNSAVYDDLVSYASAKRLPTYVTNYRYGKNTGKSDDTLAEEMLELAEHGFDLCDVMCDLYDPRPDEVARDSAAIEKQKALIARIHEKGAKVLMSAHTHKYMDTDTVVEIALEQQKRGADLAKIVIQADSLEQQLESLKTITVLKEKLDIPFLFLCGGSCGLLRRVGGELGCAMYLCVPEYDELATPLQPLLKDIKIIRDTMKI